MNMNHWLSMTDQERSLYIKDIKRQPCHRCGARYPRTGLQAIYAIRNGFYEPNSLFADDAPHTGICGTCISLMKRTNDYRARQTTP